MTTTCRFLNARSVPEPRAVDTLQLRALPIRVHCEYPTNNYVDDYAIRPEHRGALCEMDVVKERVGIEVQFGKYAFMVYNVCAKMTIFHRLGFIDVGVEVVPVKAFADEMSSGVSYFEQFLWDLDERVVEDIDIPVLVLGIDAQLVNSGPSSTRPL